MIDLYFWKTPNGYKPLILLEELELDYKLITVNIGTGEQFNPDFLKIAPNNRIPAIVDHAPLDGGSAISIFESGAILQYLAQKHDAFRGTDLRGKLEVSQWLFWQMGGVGPMAGQAHHFLNYAPEDLPYAKNRYVKEVNRLYGVLNKRLCDREYVAGDYSIADMAIWPWARLYARQNQDIGDFSHMKRWLDAISRRPAVERALKNGDAVITNPINPKDAASVLFNQDRTVVK